jgi:hypothetical protein
MAFDRLNWGEVTAPAVDWCPSGWRLWAIWPSPVDHDLCFASAGFADFADSDDAWDAAFRELLERLLSAFAPRRLGLLAGAFPRQGGGSRESLAEALYAAARDDNRAACVVGDREPATCRLRTSAGHPLIWIAQADSDLAWLTAAATADSSLEICNVRLEWSKLL